MRCRENEHGHRDAVTRPRALWMEGDFPNFSSCVLSPGRTDLAKHPWVFAERGEKARPAVCFVRNDNSCKSLLRAHSTAAHLIASQKKARIRLRPVSLHEKNLLLLRLEFPPLPAGKLSSTAKPRANH